MDHEKSDYFKLPSNAEAKKYGYHLGQPVKWNQGRKCVDDFYNLYNKIKLQPKSKDEKQK